jgi:hypothetical protein
MPVYYTFKTESSRPAAIKIPRLRLFEIFVLDGFDLGCRELLAVQFSPPLTWLLIDLAQLDARCICRYSSLMKWREMVQSI